MEMNKGVAEGVLITVLCAITGALGFLTAQKVENLKHLTEKKYTEL